MSDRNEREDELLDRAVAAMRDEATPALSDELIERTQATLRAELSAVATRRAAFSPSRHPLIRVAAVFALIACVVAVCFAFRGRGNASVVKTDVDPLPIPPEIRDPKADAPSVPVVVPPPSDPAIRGLVRFSGIAPKPQVISLAANAACAAHHRGQVIDESVLVNGDGTLRNVVVWVSAGLEGRKFAPPRESAVLDQQGCVYTPHVVTVMKGQRLLVKNSDPFLHNVRAAAANNPPFNFGQPSVDMGTPLTFLTPDRLFVKCDVHPWMNAYIMVLDNPFFAVTGEHGAFNLPELPPGTYTISAWHEVYGEQHQRVTVAAGKPLAMEFTFQPTEHASAEAVRNTPAPCCRRDAARPTILAAGI